MWTAELQIKVVEMTSKNKSKQKYNQENYDLLQIRVPKHLGKKFRELCKSRKISLAGMMKYLIEIEIEYPDPNFRYWNYERLKRLEKQRKQKEIIEVRNERFRSLIPMERIEKIRALKDMGVSHGSIQS